MVWYGVVDIIPNREELKKQFKLPFSYLLLAIVPYYTIPYHTIPFPLESRTQPYCYEHVPQGPRARA